MSSVSLAFGVCELTVRQLSLCRPRIESHRNERLRQFDPDCGVRNTPYWEGVYSGAEWNVKLKYNNLGWRDSRDYFPKADGEILVAVIGDSFVEALQVRENETFHRLLEKAFRDDRPLSKRKVRIISFACSGLGPVHEYQIFSKFVAPLRPDIVLVTICCANDFTDCHPQGKGWLMLRPIYEFRDDLPVSVRFQEPAFPHKNASSLRRFLSRMAQRSHLWRWLRYERGLAKWGRQSARFPDFCLIYEVPRRKFYEDSFLFGSFWAKKLATSITASYAVPVFSFIPTRETVDPCYQKTIEALYARESNRRIDWDNLRREFADRLPESAVVIDPTGRFRAVADPDRLYWKRDSHFTPAGHSLFAESLKDELSAVIEQVGSHVDGLGAVNGRLHPTNHRARENVFKQ